MRITIGYGLVHATNIYEPTVVDAKLGPVVAPSRLFLHVAAASVLALALAAVGAGDVACMCYEPELLVLLLSRFGGFDGFNFAGMKFCTPKVPQIDAK